MSANPAGRAGDQPAAPSGPPPAKRPPLRIISSADVGLGLRFLSADLTIFSRWGVWAQPLAVGALGAGGELLGWLDEAALEGVLHGVGLGDSRAPVRWLRTGLLPSAAAVDAVGEYVQTVNPKGYVLDPELFDGDGAQRVSTAAIESMRRKLMPRCDVLVANRHEASALSGRTVEGIATMRDACRSLVDQGAGAAVITGSHLDPYPRDLVYDGHGFDELGADRVKIAGALRGAGGILSAVVTAGLVRGLSLVEAAGHGRTAVTGAIEARLRATWTGLLRVDEVPAEEAQGGLWLANASRVGPPG